MPTDSPSVQPEQTSLGDRIAKAIISLLGSICFLLITVGALVVLNGWVLSIIWGWFVAPALHAPPLSVVQAMGIAALAGLLVKSPAPASAKDSKPDWKWLRWGIISPCISLAISWIIHLFL